MYLPTSIYDKLWRTRAETRVLSVWALEVYLYYGEQYILTFFFFVEEIVNR